MLSKYNDTNSSKDCCSGNYKFHDSVNEYGKTDTRVLVIEECDGEKKLVFKATMVACLMNTIGCDEAQKDHRRPNIHEPYISIIGTSPDCNKRGEEQNIIITSTSQEALIILHEKILHMACEEGCMLHREIFQDFTGARIEVTPYILPTDHSKIQLFKNGQLLVEDEPNAYTITGNGFDLLTDAIISDVFELIVFS